MSRPVPRGGGNIDRYAYIAYIIQAAGEGRMSRSTAVGGRRRKDVRFPGGGGGAGGNIYRYAYIILYKLNQGRRRRKDVPFHRGWRGETRGRRRRKDVPFHRGGGGKHISLCLHYI